jgi:hypothetical protein
VLGTVGERRRPGAGEEVLAPVEQEQPRLARVGANPVGRVQRGGFDVVRVQRRDPPGLELADQIEPERPQ